MAKPFDNRQVTSGKILAITIQPDVEIFEGGPNPVPTGDYKHQVSIKYELRDNTSKVLAKRSYNHETSTPHNSQQLDSEGSINISAFLSGIGGEFADWVNTDILDATGVDLGL